MLNSHACACTYAHTYSYAVIRQEVQCNEDEDYIWFSASTFPSSQAPPHLTRRPQHLLLQPQLCLRGPISQLLSSESYLCFPAVVWMPRVCLLSALIKRGFISWQKHNTLCSYFSSHFQFEGGWTGFSISNALVASPLLTGTSLLLGVHIVAKRRERNRAAFVYYPQLIKLF